MHGVNLDMLHSARYHPDGGPNDAHAHHRADHLARLRAERKAGWRLALTRIQGRFHKAAAREGKLQTSCP